MYFLKEKLNFKKLSKNERRLVLTWAVIIVILLSETAVRRFTGTLNRLNEEAGLITQKYVKLNTMLSQRSAIESSYTRAFSESVSVTDYESLLRTIEGLARNTGITILTVKSLQNKDQGFYTLYSLRIEAQDSVTELMDFLDALNAVLKGVEIERLQINAQDKDQAPRITLFLDVVAFKRI